VKIWYRRGDPGRIAEGTEHADTKGLPGQLLIVAEKLGLLCTLPRGLL
jgi:hypothetical protein